jgi:branched-chain amino acid transport system substrate-binding protein
MKKACMAVAVCAAAVFTCVPIADAADTFDMNVVLPLTGGGAFLGIAEQRALQQYEKVVAATGGIHGKTLHFVFHDDQSSPQVAVQLTNQIKTSHPPVVLGSAMVALCNAMAPLMRNGPVAYCFSPGISPAPGGYVFSSSVSTKDLAGGLLHYAGRRGWKRIALINSTDATGQDGARNFKSLVGTGDHSSVEIAADAQFNPTDVSVAAQIERLKGANPDLLVAWSTGGPIGTVFKAIRDAGLTVPVATTDGNMTNAQMTQYAAFLPKELYIPSPNWPQSPRRSGSPDADAAKGVFFKAFEGSGIKPDAPSTFAWDPALLVVEALRKLEPDATADDLRSYLVDLQGFAGVNGLYDFKRAPNRGLDESSVVVTRWDANAGGWTTVSQPGGNPLN